MQNKLLKGEDLQRGQLIKVRVGNGPWQLALVVDKKGRAWDPDDDEGRFRFLSLRLVSCALKECLPKNARQFRFDDLDGLRTLTVRQKRLTAHYQAGQVRHSPWLEWKAHKVYSSREGVGDREEYSVRFKAGSK